MSSSNNKNPEGFLDYPRFFLEADFFFEDFFAAFLAFFFTAIEV